MSIAMPLKVIQTAGIVWTLIYAAFVVWTYTVAPRSLQEAQTRASVTAGAYAVDEERFRAALSLFKREQYRAAREEWMRADPAMRDARTQFYIAYAFYREGWGRLYNDDQLFRQGLEAVNRALDLGPPAEGTLAMSDPDLGIKSAVELKAELEQGLEFSVGDLNPLRVARERK
ncbi:MAG: hypothetical protein WKF84_25855 [Pyrinomonadaceae bacterium]